MSDHNKKYSKIQEKRIAKHVRGKTQIASGALPIGSLKGDVKSVGATNWKILIDGKTSKIKHHEEGIRSKEVKKDWLNKIKQEAREGGYDLGILVISFDNKEDFYILDGKDFTNMYNALCDYEILNEGLKHENRQLREQINSKPMSAEVKKLNIEDLED